MHESPSSPPLEGGTTRSKTNSKTTSQKQHESKERNEMDPSQITDKYLNCLPFLFCLSHAATPICGAVCFAFRLFGVGVFLRGPQWNRRSVCLRLVVSYSYVCLSSLSLSLLCLHSVPMNAEELLLGDDAVDRRRAK